jgi:23S rRNA pseudouridine1911/1915/1917 synthase
VVELVADRVERLDVFLARSVAGQSRSQVAKWITDGAVSVDGAPVRRAGVMLKPGQRVVAEPPPAPVPDLRPEPVPLDVLFEDDRILVVDKPRGLATHPAPSFRGPTLVHALVARGTPLSEGSAPYRPGIVHRLDRQTTGLIVVAKDVQAHRALAAQFERREAGRVYAAVAQGRPRWEEVTVELPVGRDPKDRRRMTATTGRPASTRFRALRPAAGGTLVLAKLATGRTHQVRVHLAALGHAVRGDAVYAKGGWAEGPMQLHAALLRLRHPVSGEQVTVYSPPPEDFMAAISREETEAWA